MEGNTVIKYARDGFLLMVRLLFVLNIVDGEHFKMD